MKAMPSNARGWIQGLLIALALATTPGAPVLAHSCCDSGDESNKSSEAAASSGDVQTCSGHAASGFPDSPTGRMVHAFMGSYPSRWASAR